MSVLQTLPKVGISMSPILIFLADAATGIDLPWGHILTLGFGVVATVLSGWFYYKGDARYVRKGEQEKELKRIEEQSGRDFKQFQRELARVEELNNQTAGSVKELGAAMERHESGTRAVMHELRNSVNQHFLNFTETLGKLQGQMEALIALRRRNDSNEN